MNNMEIYIKWITERNNKDDNARYDIVDIEGDRFHALIKMSIPGMVRYNLYKIKDNERVELIHSWVDIKMARTAFELFCNEELKVFDRLNDANRQIALYDDENKRLKAIIKGMLEERYCP